MLHGNIIVNTSKINRNNMYICSVPTERDCVYRCWCIFINDCFIYKNITGHGVNDLKTLDKDSTSREEDFLYRFFVLVNNETKCHWNMSFGYIDDIVFIYTVALSK